MVRSLWDYLCYCVGICLPGDDERKQRKKRREQAYAKACELEERPPALPSFRRNLSRTSLPTHSQPSSRLLSTLPLEIRRRIYEYTLGGNVIHLTHVPKRIVHQRYPISDTNDPISDTVDIECHRFISPSWWLKAFIFPYTGQLPLTAPPEINWTNKADHIARFSRTSLSLLLSCHAIYAEAAPLLYSTIVFSISCPLILIYLHEYTLRPQHFAQIRQLQLHWHHHTDSPWSNGDNSDPATSRETWEAFWRLVTGMNLRSLGAWILYWPGEEEMHTGARWIRPMLEVEGVREVGVRIESMVGPGMNEKQYALEESLTTQWMKGAGGRSSYSAL